MPVNDLRVPLSNVLNAGMKGTFYRLTVAARYFIQGRRGLAGEKGSVVLLPSLDEVKIELIELEHATQ